ncbi:MAG: hypothetical protein ACLFNK_02195 [Candidatus Woesearchaeota archaeon]
MREMAIFIFLFFSVLSLSSCSEIDSFSDEDIGETYDRESYSNKSEERTVINDIEEDPEKVQVYFFWGDGCSFCTDQKKFFEEMDDEIMEDVQIMEFELYNSKKNAEFWEEFTAAHAETAHAIPVTFIGDEAWRGFPEQYGPQMVDKIEECVEEGCESPLEALK